MAVTARSMFTEELKAHRENAGLTQDELAHKANVSLSLLKKIENAKRRPQRDFAVWCDEFFGSPGTFERFHRLTLLETFPEWFASRMVYEEQASVITEWKMRGIPGLLQTRAYAQSVIRTGRPFDPEADLVRDINSRIERQEILDRDDPPQLWVVLAEGPLHQLVGGPAVMRTQLDHLIGMADSSMCVLQVLPFSDAGAPGIDGPATFFEFADSSSVAYLEGWAAGWVIEDPKQVAGIATALSMIKGCALSPAKSRDLIAKIRGEL
jgi:transcriptional regulator with XRE-family HTH domain